MSSSQIPSKPLADHPNTGNLPSASSSLRLARPSTDLAAAERFYVDGLGLSVLFRKTPGSTSTSSEPPEEEHDLLMVGWPGAAWHLELVHDPKVNPRPTEEDLLVLYVDGEIDPAVVERLTKAGGTRVTARNPYWEQWGVTVEDPDGYRLVLSQRGWKNE